MLVPLILFKSQMNSKILLVLTSSPLLKQSVAQPLVYVPRSSLKETCSSNIDCDSYCCFGKQCSENINCMSGIKENSDYCD